MTKRDPYFHPFRFQINFNEHLIDQAEGAAVPQISAAFSEVSGLEATMEPKVIKEGGRNWGAVQRAGQVTFSTVILKRGMTSSQNMWSWFQMVGSQAYAYRLSATITMFDTAGKALIAWKLDKVLPIKFKSADLNAKATEVAIEELHLVHEGLSQLEKLPVKKLSGSAADEGESNAGNGVNVGSGR